MYLLTLLLCCISSTIAENIQWKPSQQLHWLILLYTMIDDKSTYAEERCVYFKFYNNIYKLPKKKKQMQRLKYRKPVLQYRRLDILFLYLYD